MAIGNIKNIANPGLNSCEWGCINCTAKKSSAASRKPGQKETWVLQDQVEARGNHGQGSNLHPMKTGRDESKRIMVDNAMQAE
jgi:hypothetical protein